MKKKREEKQEGVRKARNITIFDIIIREKLSGRARVASTPDSRVAIINHSTFLWLSCCHVGIICPPLHINNIFKKELWVRWLVHYLAPRQHLFGFFSLFYSSVLRGNQQLCEKTDNFFFLEFFLYTNNNKLNFPTFLILKSLITSPHAEFKIKEAYFRYYLWTDMDTHARALINNDLKSAAHWRRTINGLSLL